MRIDMIVRPEDLFVGTPDGVDVEASGRTYAAAVAEALAHFYPSARLKVWYSPTEVLSEEPLEIHWDDGEVGPDQRDERERAIREEVERVARDVRDAEDWTVHYA